MSMNSPLDASLTAPRHHGWLFSGPGAFEARASRFLARGAERGDRLMFVANDPRPDQWPPALLAKGSLRLASIAEVYGPSGIVDAATQRATFVELLAEAVADGYTGICVAADNTRLVTDPDRLESWRGWEVVADQFMAENPVTGLCAFDREQTAVSVVASLAGAHREH